MRNRKRAILTSAILALALTLSACADDDPDNGGTDGTTGNDLTTTTIPSLPTTTLPGTTVAP